MLPNGTTALAGCAARWRTGWAGRPGGVAGGCSDDSAAIWRIVVIEYYKATKRILDCFLLEFLRNTGAAAPAVRNASAAHPEVDHGALWHEHELPLRCRTFEQFLGAVGQVLIDGQVDLGLNAPEQLGVAGADLLPELLAVEAAIGQDQHLLVDAIEEAPGELALAGVALADLGGHHRAAAAFGQGGYPCLREGLSAAALPERPNRSTLSAVSGTSSMTPSRAITLHGPNQPCPVPGCRIGWATRSNNARIGSSPNAAAPDTMRSRSAPPIPIPCVKKLQPPNQFAHDLFVGVAEE
jgi:hypothetical protein